MGSRRKARECALQMLFAADVAQTRVDDLVRDFWSELSDAELDEHARDFATRLVTGTLANVTEVDERIRSRAEHWRISRMALVDRNVLRLAVYEFLYERTPQFINGILDAIKRDLDTELPQAAPDGPQEDEAEPSSNNRNALEDSDVTT